MNYLVPNKNEIFMSIIVIDWKIVRFGHNWNGCLNRGCMWYKLNKIAILIEKFDTLLSMIFSQE